MICFDGVTKRYGAHAALDNVSFEVERGEFSFLTGPSGSGKTTILRLLTRELRATTGRVLVAGADISGLRSRQVAELRRLIAVVPQDFKLLGERNVGGNIAFALQVLGQSRSRARERVGEMLELVGLGGAESKAIRELSGGEQQRVAIARALAAGPAVLLADEPTGNLDPATSASIVELLDRICAEGTTVIMATHDLAVVNASTRRTIALDGGAVVESSATPGLVPA